MQLNVEIKKRVATYKDGTETPICGNSGDTIKFSFDDEWSAHDQKTARFIWGNKYHDVEFTGDTCEVPVVTNTQALLVGVYVGEAPDDEPLLSSTLASIAYALSVRCAKATAGAGTGANYTNEAKGYAMQAQAAAEQAEAAQEVIENGLGGITEEQAKNLKTFAVGETKTFTNAYSNNEASDTIYTSEFAFSRGLYLLTLNVYSEISGDACIFTGLLDTTDITIEGSVALGKDLHCSAQLTSDNTCWLEISGLGGYVDAIENITITTKVRRLY